MTAPSTPLRRALARVPGVVPLAEIVRSRDAKRQAAAHRRVQARELAELAQGDELLLNVGSSDSALDGWINLDLLAGQLSFQMDATKPWPFRTGSARAVNSEHMIEHLEVDELRAYLREAFRVLRPGGVIRTSTPHLRGIAEAYIEADPATLEAHREHGYEAATHGDLFNNYAYMWGHRHLWDYESLAVVLAEVGFEQIEEASFGSSRHELLDGIDRHDPSPLGSFVLCVDAVRP